MTELEEAGWRKAKDKTADQVTDVDIKSVFNLVDIDKSGTVSRTVGVNNNTRGRKDFLPLLANSFYLGSQDGRQVAGEKIWNKGCKSRVVKERCAD